MWARSALPRDGDSRPTGWTGVPPTAQMGPEGNSSQATRAPHAPAALDSGLVKLQAESQWATLCLNFSLQKLEEVNMSCFEPLNL